MTVPQLLPLMSPLSYSKDVPRYGKWSGGFRLKMLVLMSKSASQELGGGEYRCCRVKPAQNHLSGHREGHGCRVRFLNHSEGKWIRLALLE